MIQDVHTYNGAIVDNTDGNRTIVILTDKKEAYKQVFFVQESHEELIKRCRLMRSLNVASY